MSIENKKPEIFVYHDLHPEDAAMLQALYSRSPASVVEHIEKVKSAGSGKFMASYYVGYGHASIGDCGTTTIFIENYSMLAAKAIQDNALYSGQEASTRYLDFAEQPLHDPYNHAASKAILNGWMDLYNATMPKMKAALAERHPFNPEEYKSEKIWQNAINARAFDILRGFLPIGCTTLFSWTTNLRQARDRLMQLKNHPLPEIKTLAQDLFATLYEKYPNSFTGEEMKSDGRYAARDAYYQSQSERDNFISVQNLLDEDRLTEEDLYELENGGMVINKTELDVAGLTDFEAEALNTRPEGASLNRRLASYGVYNLTFLLDFGSYRDLQRHRNGICQVPLIDGGFGIYPWYMQQVNSLLSEDDYQTFESEVIRLLTAIEDLPQTLENANELQTQYLFPMGTSVMCNLTYTIPQMVYVAELRAQKTVHASLRPIAQAMGRVLKADFPDMAIYIDEDADSWSAKRGEQTIEAKAA